MIRATRNAVSAAYTSLKESAANQLRGFIGATGTMILGGYITGEDFNTEWEDDKAVENAREMVRQDSMINGTMMAIKLPPMSAKPWIEPASDQNIDIKLAEFAEMVWFDNPFFTWSEWVRNALYYLDFGFEVMEKSYVPFPGIGEIPKFQHRKPETIERWHVGEDGELGSVEQLAFHPDIQRFKNATIPFEKIFHISRDQEGDNYRGLSILRSAWRPYKIKDLLIRIDAIKGERWGAGIPRGKMTAGGDERKLIAALQDLRANEKGYLYEDKNYSIDLLTIAGRAGVDLIPSIELHNKEINANILREHASLGTQSSTGSWALGETLGNFFMLSFGAILTHLEEIVNRGSGNMEHMKQIIDINFPRVDKYPQLKIERPKLRDTKEVANAVTSFTQAGVITPDEELEDHVRKLYDLPKKTEPRRIDSRRAPVVGVLGRARKLTALEASILDVRTITSSLSDAVRTIGSAARGHRDEAISKALQFRSSKIIKEARKSADVDKMIEETVLQNSGALAKALKSEAWSMHVSGAESIRAELDRQGTGVEDPPARVKSMQAYRDTDLWAVDLASGFCTEILKEWSEAVRLFWLSDDKETRNPVRGVILSAGENLIESGAQRLVLAAFGMGRRREIERSKHLIEKLHRSEALEAPNCGNCAAIDGIEFDVGSDKHKHLADGPNKECTASACWGLNIPIANSDQSPRNQWPIVPNTPVRSEEKKTSRWWRNPTEFERKILNLAEMDDKVIDNHEKLIAKADITRQKFTGELIEMGLKLISKHKSIAELQKAIDSTEVPRKLEMVQNITNGAKELFDFGRKTILDELKRQGVEIKQTSDEFLSSEDPTSALIIERISEAVKAIPATVRSAVNSYYSQLHAEWGEAVLTTFKSGKITKGLIKSRVEKVGLFKRAIMRIANESFGLGRNSEIVRQSRKLKPPKSEWSSQEEKVFGGLIQRSEILDRLTCDPCRAVDGIIVGLNDPQFADFSVGPYTSCKGANLCRGFNMPLVQFTVEID